MSILDKIEVRDIILEVAVENKSKDLNKIWESIIKLWENRINLEKL